MAGIEKTYVKAGIIAVAVVTALVLLFSHPILSVIIVLVAGAFYLVDSGSIGI